MANTLNYGFPKPDIANNIDEEFYVFRDTTLDMIDAAIKAVADSAAAKAALVHSHEIGDVTGLAGALSGKMPADTTFSLDSLTDVDGAAGAAVNNVLVKNSSGQWVPSSALAALGPHGHLISEITGLVDALAGKADATATATALANRVRFDASQSKTQAERGQARANIGGGVLSGFRNKLINGDGAVDQRRGVNAYGPVNDNVYWCDRHYVLTQTAAITPTTINDVADDLPHMMRLSQSQAAAQRMGNAQIVEANVAKKLRGKTVTLGGKIRCSSSQPIRFAILAFGGTDDNFTVHRDFVSNWASASFVSGAFFSSAPFIVVAGIGSITPVANTLTDFSLVAPLGNVHKNLMVFCWTEGVAAQNVTLDMAWQLVEGDASAEVYPYEVRHPQQEIDLCQRYYQKVRSQFRMNFSAVGTHAITLNIPTMRTIPTTVNLLVQTSTGISSESASSISDNNVVHVCTPSAAGNGNSVILFGLDAEL